MKTIIIIIVILLSFILFLNRKKVNIKNKNKINSSIEPFVNNLTAPKDIKTLINNCNNEGNVIYNDLTVANNVKIGNKNGDQYIKDYLFPIGSFYVQFAQKNSNIIFEAFPDSETPEALFGGTWQEQWPFESIFFRTRGTLSNENREDGFQNYALKHLYGHMGWTQTNLWKPGQGADGVFGTNIEIQKIGTDSSTGEVVGHRNVLNISDYYSTSKLETRPDSRLIRVWKKIPDVPRGKNDYEEMLRKKKIRNEIMEKGWNYKYDNNWYFGPTPFKVIPNATVFRGIDNIDAAKKECNKTNGCYYIQRKLKADNKQEYSWSSIQPVEKIDSDDNFNEQSENYLNDKESLIWERKKIYNLEVQDEIVDDEFNDAFKFYTYSPELTDPPEFADGMIDYGSNVEPYYDTDEFGNTIDKPFPTTFAFE
jgi:hypothetical protein